MSALLHTEGGGRGGADTPALTFEEEGGLASPPFPEKRSWRPRWPKISRTAHIHAADLF